VKGSGAHHETVRVHLTRRPLAAGVAQVEVGALRAAHARAHVDLQPARVARRRKARRLHDMVMTRRETFAYTPQNRLTLISFLTTHTSA